MTISREILEKFSEYPVFRYGDVERYLKGERRRTGDLARIIAYLKKTGRIRTVVKGVYTVAGDSMVSGFAYSPFYYGLLSALTIRELWTQNSRPEIMTVKSVRASKVQIFGDADDLVFVHHIPARYFFGYDVVKYGKLSVPVSNPEKTLIDLFYYKVRLPIQDYGDLLRAVSKKKLNTYLKAYDRRIAVAVQNFVKKYKTPASLRRLQERY